MRCVVLQAMWWEVVSAFVGLQLLAGFCSGVTVTQKERFKIIQVGTQASLDCNHDDSSYITILWYRQDGNSAEKQLKLVGYSVQGNNPEMTMTTYSINRPDVRHASLSVPPRQAADSAVYFCAASKGTGGSYEVHFGPGTRLTVLEKGQKTSPPEVTIFAPSAQEVEDKQKATIVCLATDFFPDHVSITWFMNGEARTEGVKTDTPELDKTKKKYSLVSRLRITKKEWQDSSNKFKCRIEFYDENGESHYEDEISGIECGGSAEAKETYLRRANVGKLVYILLIFKSFLYGAFVMGLKLQKKVAP